MCGMAPGFNPAGSRQNSFRSEVVDANGELVRREAAEHDGVDGAQTRAREHGNNCLGNHGHVDHHAVPLAYSERPQSSCRVTDLVQQLRVAVDHVKTIPPTG